MCDRKKICSVTVTGSSLTLLKRKKERGRTGDTREGRGQGGRPNVYLFLSRLGGTPPFYERKKGRTRACLEEKGKDEEGKGEA